MIYKNWKICETNLKNWKIVELNLKSWNLKDWKTKQKGPWQNVLDPSLGVGAAGGAKVPNARPQRPGKNLIHLLMSGRYLEKSEKRRQ